MSNPLVLSWSEAEISKRGNCKDAISEAVLIHLPVLDSKEARHPLLRESDPEYVRNDPIALETLKLTEVLPKDGSTGFAFEMATLHEVISYEEAYQHVRGLRVAAMLRGGTLPKEDEFNQLVNIDLLTLGISFGKIPMFGEFHDYGLEVKNGEIYRDAHRFIRWVDETEFNEKYKKAEEIKAKAPPDTEPAWIFNRWYFALTDESRANTCKSCPLNLENLRMPGKNFWMDTRGCYIDFPESDADALFGHLAGITTFKILNKNREFGEALSIEQCSKLKEELKLGRGILKKTRVHAIAIYDKSGEKIHTEFPMGIVPESFPGYRVGIKQGDSLISVRFRAKQEGPDSFDTDLDSGETMPTLKFKSIVRQDNNWVGVTPSGKEVELPDYEDESVIDTDFISGRKIDPNSIQRLEVEGVSGWDAFGGIIEAIEGYLKRSEELGLQVVL